MKKPIWVIHRNGEPFFHSQAGTGPWIGDRSAGRKCSMLAAYRLKGDAVKAIKSLENGRDIWEIEVCLLADALVPPSDFTETLWSVRTRNCLQNIGVTSFVQLTEWTSAELLKVKNLGRKSLREIENHLAAKGMKLKS